MPTIPPFLVTALATLLRQWLLLLAGALGLQQVLDPLIAQYLTPDSQFLLGLATAILTIGYGLWAKFRDKQKLVMAASVARLSVGTVEALVASPTTPTPSVNTPKHEIPR